MMCPAAGVTVGAREDAEGATPRVWDFIISSPNVALDMKELKGDSFLRWFIAQ